jgi:hypothetical protein
MIFNKLNYVVSNFEITKIELTLGDEYVSDLVLSVPKGVPISVIKTDQDDIQSLKQLDIDSVIFGKSLVDQGDSIWIPLLLKPFFGTGNFQDTKVTIVFQGNLESADQVGLYGKVYLNSISKEVNISHQCTGIITLKKALNKITIQNPKKTNLMYFYGTYLEAQIKSISLTLNDFTLFDLDPKAIRINQFYRGHSTDAMIVYFADTFDTGINPGTLELSINYLGETDATINVTCYSI